MGDHHFNRARSDRALSAAERADARSAIALLAGSGLTLEAAAAFAREAQLLANPPARADLEAAFADLAS